VFYTDDPNETYSTTPPVVTLPTVTVTAKRETPWLAYLILALAVVGALDNARKSR
jgi:hypothetical protein